MNEKSLYFWLVEQGREGAETQILALRSLPCRASNMVAHALLSPSSAERWMQCPGSVALSYGAPDSSSEYADEGTAAHELAAMCLRAYHDNDEPERRRARCRRG